MLEFALGTHGLRIDGTPLLVSHSGADGTRSITLPQPLPENVAVVVEHSIDAVEWKEIEATMLSDDRNLLVLPTAAPSDVESSLYRLRFMLEN